MAVRRALRRALDDFGRLGVSAFGATARRVTVVATVPLNGISKNRGLAGTAGLLDMGAPAGTGQDIESEHAAHQRRPGPRARGAGGAGAGLERGGPDSRVLR